MPQPFDERRAALNPASIETRDYLSQAESALGTANWGAGDLEPAARSYRAAVEIREQIVREQPGSAGYRRSLILPEAGAAPEPARVLVSQAPCPPQPAAKGRL